MADIRVLLTLLGSVIGGVLASLADIILTLLGSVIGGVLASLIAIFIWERHRQPKLAIEIPDKIPGKEPAIQQLNQISRAFYHLRVVNRGKTPAYNCRITMRFKEVNTGKQLFEVNGKWDRGPQPLLYALVPKRILPNGEIRTVRDEFPHDFLVPFAEVIDIHPKMPESFCVVIKYENEEECYGFSSWSYLKGRGFRVNEWKLNIGEYIIEVELTYSGKKFLDKFLLINPSRNIKDVEIRRYDANKK
ncbi:MAG: hypothetical protein OCU16_03625 [Candidatus Methanospirare jalkutatii]|nr:hypothetical protein [Candidatus Methanospirare jalkutatii]